MICLHFLTIYRSYSLLEPCIYAGLRVKPSFYSFFNNLCCHYRRCEGQAHNQCQQNGNRSFFHCYSSFSTC